ncbi:four-carbon acid sugar kinase family protein [Rhabdobacter roseus]|uniref:Uncharacterized protein YgbK (DUF1537 family) n=1 Tax=Rhabdobacter roseus TaxID=1655419 RepID=A0A840TVM4_9BACT|nr:four-carbon acid sugar kinase family protein [Rhabdobacter roseus]MBB5283709.1 uncharacterized protein YgbK (DUF1537 family) [Rhabdobacter roseus]
MNELEDRHDVFLSYYGDDFTGSTDVMEALTLNGLPTALFLHPPTVDEIEHFKLKNNRFPVGTQIQAFGVAGTSRSLSPAQMNAELPPIFQEISRISSRFFHYKVCSTFDSSPEIGSIGHAIDLACRYFPSSFIPLVVGAPNLNRFCAFGNLFARVGSTTYRLDRHPTMSRHPITPMQESDLRLHLSKQTPRKVHMLDVLSLEEGDDQIEKLIQQAKEDPSAPFLLMDVINQDHLKKIGEIILRHSQTKNQLLVGSSGIEAALTACLQKKNSLTKYDVSVSVAQASKMIVMAGSCSPTTQKQIEYALKAGFAGIRINSQKLVDPAGREPEIQRVVALANQLLRQKNVLLYTALGPDDPAIADTRAKLEVLSDRGALPADFLAKIQGKMLLQILEEHHEARVIVAGGDTSGYVAEALEIYALEVLIPVAPGAPLCMAHSKNTKFDGLEIALKGGQCGQEDYFESVYWGTTQKDRADPVSVTKA